MFGAERPDALAGLALPPSPMPAHHAGRPLKAWRYVGVYGPEAMLCVAAVRIGRARQSFWAVWDRRAGVLRHGRCRGSGSGGLTLRTGSVDLRTPQLTVSLALAETAGIETVAPSGGAYAWTRKQGGVTARGTIVTAGGRLVEVDAPAIIDDTAAYYERHTLWRWSAGVGVTADGAACAWNLVDGVNDGPVASERTVWVDGIPFEPAPVAFAADLSRVAGLDFTAEATHARRQNLLLVRSHYRQPFGTFAGRLPGGPELAAGYGVMELHDAYW